MDRECLRRRHIIPHNNAAKLVSSDPELGISSQQAHKVDPPRPRVSPPIFDEHVEI